MNTHPLHSVHTGRNECDAVLVAQPNRQTCSHCQLEIFTPNPAFHCQMCDFKLCRGCDKGSQHPAHVQHPLYFLNPSAEYGGSWRCDVCKKSTQDVRETCCYHCPVCKFDLCKNCFTPANRPLHEHCLIRTDVRYVYHQSNGEWCCDICGNNNGPGNYFPWHCKTCQFDLCDNCCKPWYSSFHPNHELFKANSKLVYPQFNGGWCCDQCKRTFTPENDNKPYHCSICEYDLCEDCMRNSWQFSNQVGFDVPRPCGIDARQGDFGVRNTSTVTFSGQQPVRGFTHGSVTLTSTMGNPIASPEEDVEEQIGRSGLPDDAGECIICLEKPKDATIVHGLTGHVCCCMACAQELKRKGAPCPICRAPIDRVIKQYSV